jgi:hypothetical protein
MKGNEFKGALLKRFAGKTEIANGNIDNSLNLLHHERK